MGVATMTSPEVYKEASELVLKKWETETDDKGRSQLWKVHAVKEDSKAGRDSGIMRIYVEEVERLVDQFETLTAEIKDKITIKPPSGPVAAEPIEPASPADSTTLDFL